jgi:hypothetical protein
MHHNLPPNDGDAAASCGSTPCQRWLSRMQLRLGEGAKPSQAQAQAVDGSLGPALFLSSVVTPGSTPA